MPACSPSLPGAVLAGSGNVCHRGGVPTHREHGTEPGAVRTGSSDAPRPLVEAGDTWGQSRHGSCLDVTRAAFGTSRYKQRTRPRRDESRARHRTARGAAGCGCRRAGARAAICVPPVPAGSQSGAPPPPLAAAGLRSVPRRPSFGWGHMCTSPRSHPEAGCRPPPRPQAHVRVRSPGNGGVCAGGLGGSPSSAHASCGAGPGRGRRELGGRDSSRSSGVAVAPPGI